jgi:hypothetical protein
MGQLATKIISAFCFALILFISPGSSLAANAPIETQHEQVNTPNSQQKGSSKAGMVGVVVGGAAGGMASVAAVSATGSVAGLGAAGMTSGLASMGSLIGGGMLGGLAVSVALPIIGAAGVGWAAYKIFHHPVDSPSSPAPIINNFVDKSTTTVITLPDPPIEVHQVDMSSLIYVVFAVALLFSLLAMVVFFSKYSKDMNRKLNDLTALVVDRELDA